MLGRNDTMGQPLPARHAMKPIALLVLAPLLFVSLASQAQASVWQEVGQAIGQEFSDIDDVGQFTRTVLRLLMAAVLGGLLGWEREAQGKAAGLRTHMLVAMGAALVITVMQLKGASVDELARVVQGVIAGVGFLGAGTILKRQFGQGEAVAGLTTAAGLWFTAAVGVAIGLGEESTAIVSALLAFCVLTLVPHLSPAPKHSDDAEKADAAHRDKP